MYKYKIFLFTSITLCYFLMPINCYSNLPIVWIATDEIIIGKYYHVNLIYSAGSGSVVTITYPNNKVYSSIPKVTTSNNGFLSYKDLSKTQFASYSRSITVTNFECYGLWTYGAYYYETHYLIVDPLFPFQTVVMTNIVIVAPITISSVSSSVNIGIQTLTQPLSNYKAIVFISCFCFQGTHETTTPFSAYYNLTWNLLSSTIIQFNYQFGQQSAYIYMHANIVIVDQYSINNSPHYRMGCGRINFYAVGSQFGLPDNLDSSLFTGLTDFVGTSTSQYISYNLTYKLLSSGLYGIQLQKSNPPGSPILNYGIMYFYVQKFGYYIYPTSNNAQIDREGCNGFIIKLLMDNAKYHSIRTAIQILNPNVTITSVAQDASQNYVLVSAEYQRSILNQSIILTTSMTEVFEIKYDYVVPPFCYNQSQCQMEQNIQNLVTAFLIISYITLFVSLISGKIIGLQLFGVLQLAYFSLVQQTHLNICMAPFIKLKIANGFNVQLLNQVVNMPSILKGMAVFSNFINNFNVMFILFIVQLIFSMLIYIFSKLSFKVQYKVFLKQGLITLVLFNCLNISFSAGIQLKYLILGAENYILNLIFTILALIIVFVSICLLQCTEQKGFGQFKFKFKDSFINKLFITFTVLYRTFLGFFLAMQFQYDYNTMIIVAVSFIFMLYLISNLPFIDTYQNYRSCFCHFTMILILSVNYYYRTFKSETPIQIKSFIFSPAIVEIIFIGLTVLISLCALIYEIYLLIKAKKQLKRIVNKKEEYSKNIFTHQQFIITT